MGRNEGGRSVGEGRGRKEGEEEGSKEERRLEWGQLPVDVMSEDTDEQTTNQLTQIYNLPHFTSKFRSYPPTSQSPNSTVHKNNQGASQILAPRITTRISETSRTPRRTSERKGSLLSNSPPHGPAFICTGNLTGLLVTSMTSQHSQIYYTTRSLPQISVSHFALLICTGTNLEACGMFHKAGPSPPSDTCVCQSSDKSSHVCQCHSKVLCAATLSHRQT